MTSKALETGNFLNHLSSPGILSKDEKTQGYRHHTVYDAVAGSISSTGFIPKLSVISSARDTASSSASAAPPETVLYQSRNAPPRYAESDVYFANERRLVTDLPGSDLLKSLHCYASDFYSRSCPDRGLDDWKSLDETALLAIGILLEELSLESLGKTGDLVFTEGEDEVSRMSSFRGNKSKSKERPSKKRRLVVAENS